MDSGYSGSEEIASQKYPGGGGILQTGPEAMNDQKVRQKKEGHLQNMWIATLYRRPADNQESR